MSKESVVEKVADGLLDAIDEMKAENAALKAKVAELTAHNSASTPFCDACLEPDCLCGLDETCAMIRVYLKAKRRT